MKYIQIILAAMLFICLLDMPYGYYQFIRFFAMATFVILAFHEYQSSKEIGTLFLIYIMLAILFQPIFKIAFGRFIWNVIDVIVGIFLFINSFKRKPI